METKETKEKPKDEQILKAIVDKGVMDTSSVFCIARFDIHKLEELKDAGFELTSNVKSVNEPDRNRVVLEIWDKNEKEKLVKINNEYADRLEKIMKALGIKSKDLAISYYAKKDKPLILELGSLCFGIIAPISES